ncbi:FecCD family ABC transporter permease [Psychrosphaera aestuarii]|uniref:FecCD family ABC transporter permease n=1 Tax=Psychrosphaera aestuarii TaxID=1266052 RepID=UPI001B32F21B|nr:iron ABC transporter permease [Psychrosphaera aestuarii]
MNSKKSGTLQASEKNSTSLFLKSFIAIAILLFSVMFALSFGAVEVPVDQVISCLFQDCDSSINTMIVQELRLPRVLLALFAGAGLALSGAMLQNATNNALADPYLFGIVSGAGLGAIVYNLLGIELGSVGMTFFAFAGALISVLLVMSVVINKAFKRPEIIVLTGVAVSFMMAALSQFLLYVSEPLAANRIIFWLMGSVSFASFNSVYLVATVVTLSSVILWLMRSSIDALLLGDEQAKSIGVNVDAIRIILLLFSAAMTAVIVAFCGGIGFVGLMIPHIVRWFGFTRMSTLIPAVLITGGLLLLWVDVIARTSIENQEIPLGVITSACGSLFFLLILKKKARV